MKPASVILREAAHADLDEAIGFYMSEGAPDAALGLIEAVQHAPVHILRHPESGSPRYAQELGLPGLRHWVVQGYPYLVFYVVREEAVDVWRILHGERDIPAWMR